MKLRMLLSFFLLSLLLFSLAEAQSPNSMKQEAKISNHAYEHIKERHWHHAKSGNKTSHFNRDMNVRKLNKIAAHTLNRGRQDSSKWYNGRKVHEYTFSKPIGRTTEGNNAKTLRVVSDGRGNVITAFPAR